MTVGTTGTFSMVVAAMSFVDNQINAIIHATVGIILAGLTALQVPFPFPFPFPTTPTPTPFN